MVGIILAGGSGTRLWPLTKHTSKQLLPVYDKPMIYYPLGTLMLAGIREIVIISTPRDIDSFKLLLGDGSAYGIQLHYVVQEKPLGLVQAFPLSEKYIQGKKVCLILGDNIFYGPQLGGSLTRFTELIGGQIFGYKVRNPEDYGVVVLDADGEILRIEEKPENSLSNIAIPGLYFYDEKILDIASKVKPSPRGELEISTLNNLYLEQNNLKIEILPRGTAWFDTGDINNLLEASLFVKTIETRQGTKICCPEEIALAKSWITKGDLRINISKQAKNDYRDYLELLLLEHD